MRPPSFITPAPLSPERLVQITGRVENSERTHVAAVAFQYGQDVPALLAALHFELEEGKALRLQALDSEQARLEAEVKADELAAAALTSSAPAATPAPADAAGAGEAGEAPFDALAFNARVEATQAERRKKIASKPGGDTLLSVAVARSMVGDGNPKHEPYLSMITDLVEAYDEASAAVVASPAATAAPEAGPGVGGGGAWVSVAERLPVAKCRVLAVFKEGAYSNTTTEPVLATFLPVDQFGRPNQFAVAGGYNPADKFSHWLPLPHPYIPTA